jgi:hypothetical protein
MNIIKIGSMDAEMSNKLYSMLDEYDPQNDTIYRFGASDEPFGFMKLIHEGRQPIPLTSVPNELQAWYSEVHLIANSWRLIRRDTYEANWSFYELHIEDDSLAVAAKLIISTM